MKSNTFKEYIQPVVVLVAICLVITFALAYVNSITAPIIADNTKGKTLGVFGEETVNVLGVNLDIALAMGLVGEISK